MLKADDQVKVKNPNSLTSDIRKKIAGRIGYVESISTRGNGLFVVFRKEGRRKEFRQWFSSESFLDPVLSAKVEE